MQIGKQSSKYSTFPYSPFSYRTRILTQLTLSYFCSTPLTSVRLHLTHQFSRTLGHEQEKLSHLDKGSSEPLTMSVNETYEVLSYAELRIRFNTVDNPKTLESPARVALEGRNQGSLLDLVIYFCLRSFPVV